MTEHAFAERLALADEMAQVGPDAPTLCGDWTVRDLLAHLILRERRPDAAAGIVIKPLAARTQHVQRAIAARDFTRLLADLRDPPWWSPVSNPLLDELTNLNEMFLHHEDVRRAAPGWQPRDLPVTMQLALWRQLGMRSRLVLRRFRARVRIEAPGFGSYVAGAAARDGESLPEVMIVGDPAELTVFLSGRQAHAQVTVDGPPDVVERLRRARFGV